VIPSKLPVSNCADLVIFRPSSQLDPYYLALIFNSTLGRSRVAGNLVGVAQQHFNVNVAKEMVVNIPPLSTQRKIASILSAYDDLIENNTRRIAILEEMAQSLYREWFVHFRFPGHEKKRLVESKLGLIPEGWEVVKLGDIAQEIRRGVNPEAIDPETPYIGLEHLPRKSIALSEWGKAKEVQSTKLLFKKGEILFGKIRPYFHKVGVAPVDGVCSTDTIVIVPCAEEYFAITLCCVSSDEFVDHATQTSQGTKMPRANWDILVRYPIVLPPSPILSRFNEFVREMVMQIQNMIYRNRNLRQTRDLLLPKLISGEVDVEGLNIHIEGGTYESHSNKLAEISSGDETVHYSDLPAHI
jgi:type I restriction enzyme, S subunit